MKSKNPISNKVVFLALLGLAGFFSYLKYQQYRQYKQIESEKNKILAQIDVLQKKNKEISDSLSYFNSEGFKQRIARQQFNFKQPDEQVYSFMEKQTQAGEEKSKVREISNFKKWLLYFSGQGN